MTRPGFLTITAVACLLGIASAASSNGSTDWRLALLTLVLALAAHAGANVLNDYHDALNGADAANQIEVPGYTATLLAVLGFGGLNTLGLGIVGTYAWRAYENTKQRPLSMIQRKFEFNTNTTEKT